MSKNKIETGYLQSFASVAIVVVLGIVLFAYFYNLKLSFSIPSLEQVLELLFEKFFSIYK